MAEVSYEFYNASILCSKSPHVTYIETVRKKMALCEAFANDFYKFLNQRKGSCRTIDVLLDFVRDVVADPANAEMYDRIEKVVTTLGPEIRFMVESYAVVCVLHQKNPDYLHVMQSRDFYADYLASVKLMSACGRLTLAHHKYSVYCACWTIFQALASMTYARANTELTQIGRGSKRKRAQ